MVRMLPAKVSESVEVSEPAEVSEPVEASEPAMNYRQNKKTKQQKIQTIWHFMENNVKKQKFF